MNRTIYNPVIKDSTTFIHTASETNNRFTEVEVTLMPAGGTPLHYHNHYSETFKVSQGELSIIFGNKAMVVLKPGSHYTVSKGTQHRFFNATGKPVVFKVLIEPGCAGFENALRIMYGLATDGHTNAKALPKSWKHIAVITNMSDMNSPGILSLIAPLFRWYAKSKAGQNTERLLLNRYCGAFPLEQQYRHNPLS